VVSVLTAAAVAALAAFLLWPRTPDHVLVVGDSVTFMSFEALGREFGPDTDLEALARPGFRSTELLPLALEAMDRRDASGETLDRAIFLVGYNDIWQDETDHEDLEALVAESARHECAIWLTVPTSPGGEPPTTRAGNRQLPEFDPGVARAWNERLADLVAEHDSLHLVTEWQTTIDEAPPSRYLDRDGIHPNDAGQERLAAIMHDSLLSACRFP
jgi:lysophospholipase L1-like esterase